MSELTDKLENDEITPGYILFAQPSAEQKAAKIINDIYGFDEEDCLIEDLPEGKKKLKLGPCIYYSSVDDYDCSYEFTFYEPNYKEVNHLNFPIVSSEKLKELQSKLGCCRLWINFCKKCDVPKTKIAEIYIGCSGAELKYRTDEKPWNEEPRNYVYKKLE